MKGFVRLFIEQNNRSVKGFVELFTGFLVEAVV